MKTFSANLTSLLGFIVAFLAMYAFNYGSTLTPATVKVFGIVTVVLSAAMKTPWLMSKEWKNKQWSTAFWITNITYFVTAVFSDLLDSGLIAAGVGIGIVQGLNLIIAYFGGGSEKVAKN